MLNRLLLSVLIIAATAAAAFGYICATNNPRTLPVDQQARAAGIVVDAICGTRPHSYLAANLATVRQALAADAVALAGYGIRATADGYAITCR